MVDRTYAYPSEKLATARRILMLPHPKGEEQDIMLAFHECHLGLHDIREEDLDDDARFWVAKLRALMDTSGLTDHSSRGLWVVKAELLTLDERAELSQIVNDLAFWFGRRFWSDE